MKYDIHIRDISYETKVVALITVKKIKSSIIRKYINVDSVYPILYNEKAIKNKYGVLSNTMRESERLIISESMDSLLTILTSYIDFDIKYVSEYDKANCIAFIENDYSVDLI